MIRRCAGHRERVQFPTEKKRGIEANDGYIRCRRENAVFHGEKSYIQRNVRSTPGVQYFSSFGRELRQYT